MKPTFAHSRISFTRSSRFRFAALCRLAALLASAASAHAEHFYASWIQEFKDGSQQGQRVAAVATDSRGNVVMTGDAMSDSGYHQYYTAKYDGLDGHLIWESYFGVTQGKFGVGQPTGDAFARSVAVDSADNVIVTGGASYDNTMEDFVTIKYDANGGLFWAKSYDNGGGDEAIKVVIDRDDNVIVAGTSHDSTSGDDFLTIKYDPTGTPLFSGGSRRFARKVNNINCIDTVADVAVDKNGNVWVTGSSNISGVVSFLTVLYSSGGSLSHIYTYTSPGAGDGAKAVVCNSAGDAIVTGNDTTSSGNDGFYTVQYRADGTTAWTAKYSSGFDDHVGGARSVGIDANNDVFVTGAVTGPNPNNTATAVTIKYAGSSSNTGSVLWMTSDTGISPIGKTDPNKNLPIFETLAHQLVVDGAGQVIVVGESAFSEDDNADVYFAKYDGTTGKKLFASSYNGPHSGPDFGFRAAVDVNGNVAIGGTEKRDVNTIGYDGIVTLKYKRILAEPGDDLPPNPITNKPRTISALNAPALATSGDVAVRITLADGKAKLGAILTQGPSGDSRLPIIQGDHAPNVLGYGNATFKSFGEPSLNPNGEYAFTAKLAGGVPTAKSNSLWTNLGGTLHLALQQGTPLPGLNTVTVSSVMSVSIRNSQLVALVKIAGPAASNLVLLSLDKNNIGTVLLRTGAQNILTVNNVASYLTTLTALSPTATSPGDGRTQGDAFSVARGVLKDGRSAIFRLSPSAVVTALVVSGDTAPVGVNGAKWKSFGLPAVGESGFAYAVLGTVAPIIGITKANDTAIVYSGAGGVGSFTNLVAHEGSPSPIANISYSTLSDPVVNSAGKVAYLATLTATAGGGASVTKNNNRALFYGLSGSPAALARTGDKAPDVSGAASTSSFASFSAIALPAGKPGGPIFVAKLTGGGATAKTNVGVWGVDTHNVLRRLLRTGDHLGNQVVSSITLLKATPQAFVAARSFNESGGVIMLVGFTNHTTGVLEIGLP